ncbi:MAG TPA: hypothetical protein VJ953_22690 [Saprospiraceae bacterium]|nr:hypothetical protein [Saprospiraceae bacterium]
MKIKGKVIHENIGMGVWAIKDEAGNIWTPINMPEQLKYKGKEVKVVAKKVEVMTTTMFGESVKILSFETMQP